MLGFMYALPTHIYIQIKDWQELFVSTKCASCSMCYCLKYWNKLYFWNHKLKHKEKIICLFFLFKGFPPLKSSLYSEAVSSDRWAHAYPGCNQDSTAEKVEHKWRIPGGWRCGSWTGMLKDTKQPPQHQVPDPQAWTPCIFKQLDLCLPYTDSF